MSAEDAFNELWPASLPFIIAHRMLVDCTSFQSV